LPRKPSIDHPDYVANDDRVTSDVDVVGYHPMRRGRDRVWVVSCKSWQGGFDATRKLKELRGEVAQPKRATWRHFRELWVPKWAEALRATIKELTGTSTFRYFIAVTSLRGNGEAWRTEPTIRENLGGFGAEFLTLATMWREYLDAVGTTPQPSEIGRLAQLLKAAGADGA
jgi:hypothetical protein